jgi:hypothetical protein
MSDATTPPAANDLGVVDPIQMPAPLGRAGAWMRSIWNRLPVLGRFFVLLAVADVIGRGLGLAGTSLSIELAAPMTLLFAFVPHDLLILLPAVLLLRRPNAARDTPLVLGGAVVVALLEVLAEPIGNILGGLGDGPTIGIAASIATSFIDAGGWLAIAVGLAALNPARPGQSIAGLANLVGGALAIAAVVGLASVLIGPRADIGEEVWNTLLFLASAAAVIPALVWAFLARTVIRGTGDAGRPLIATYLATGAFILAGIGAAVTATVVFLGIVQVAFAVPTGILGWATGFGWLGGASTTILVLLAFGLGLADTPGPEAAPEPVAEEGPSWPAPGADVPAWREPETRA